MRKFLSVAALIFAAAVFSAEPTASHRAAAEEFLLAKRMPEALESQCLLMTEKQIAAQPELAAIRGKLLDFYRGILGFEALKEDLVNIYVREFTEDELRELTRFCNTPVGRKTAEFNVRIISEFAELLERKVREKAAASN